MHREEPIDVRYRVDRGPAWDTPDLFVGSAEAPEGLAAFQDKRRPDFVLFRGAAAGQAPACQPVAP
ncbi:MAG: hypothetical protein JWM67_1555 [Mycobacterium sp.]|nr:hypothetical protein [Mycobacterium sp.]